MKDAAFALAAAAWLAGCAAWPADPRDTSIVHIDGVEGFDRFCPAVGNPRFESGLSLPRQVEHAFDEALARAGVRASPGRVTGRLTRAEIAARGLSVGTYWDVALLLASPDGRGLGVELRYAFEPGMGMVAGCKDAGDALATAIRLVVDKAVADPRFTAMLQ